MGAWVGVWMRAVLCLLIVPCTWSLEQKNGQPEKDSAMDPIVGKLTRVFAIGGETTGWAVQLESERKINDAEVKQIEVDPAPRKIQLDTFEDKQVEITGTLTWRQGVERGEYPVVVIETIREREPGNTFPNSE